LGRLEALFGALNPPWRRGWRTRTTNDIVLFRLPATRLGKARHGTEIYEQWQGPNNRARVNNLVKWDCGWWHKYTNKQARAHWYKS